MTRILLVDDHPLFLDGVRAALMGADDLEVVGEAHDGLDRHRAGRRARAGGGAHGPQPAGRSPESRRPAASCATAPDTRVLMMTMSADDDAVVAAMRAGARGYVVKGAGREDLLHAIRTVAAGGAVFSPTVADRLGRFFTGMATGGGREAFPQLTGREMEVLDLLARGLENRRIAREAAPLRQDRAQPRVQRAHQARRRGSIRGRRPSAGGRPRKLTREGGRLSPTAARASEQSSARRERAGRFPAPGAGSVRSPRPSRTCADPRRSRRRLLLRQQAAAVGEGDDLRAVLRSQLGDDPRDVHAGGLGRHEQGLGDLLVGSSLGDEDQHLLFPVGELPGAVVAVPWRGWTKSGLAPQPVDGVGERGCP